MALKKENSTYDLRLGEEFYRYIFHDKSKRKQDELIKDMQRVPQHDTGVLFEYALTSINPSFKMTS